LTLVRAFKRPWQISGIFLGFPGSLPAEVEVRGTGWRFAVRSKLDVWVIKETCIDQDYLRGIEIDPSWSIVDIGAGLGDFTVLAASACPDGLVHAYEPHSQSFDLLKHNLTLNQIDRVACYNEAAGVAAQRLRPEHEGGDAVSTSFVKASGKTSGKSSVPSVNLNQILARLPGEKCDLMKIDCEGCEFEFLMKADRESLSKIRRLTIEAHDGYFSFAAEDLTAHLVENGFTVSQEPNSVHSYLSLLYAER
jgi:FkbM family methyltransferase